MFEELKIIQIWQLVWKMGSKHCVNHLYSISKAIRVKYLAQVCTSEPGFVPPISVDNPLSM